MNIGEFMYSFLLFLGVYLGWSLLSSLCSMEVHNTVLAYYEAYTKTEEAIC